MNAPARQRSRPSDVCRYVALGEGFTEGVGDDDRRLPNGVRGWADRIAEGLAAAAPGWEYANLAVRGRRFGAVEGEQLPAALALGPTLVSLSVGARDILVPPAALDELVGRYAAVVDALVSTGATVVLFTRPCSPVLGGPDDRAFRYDEMVRAVGRERGAVVIDPWGDGPFRMPQLWAPGGAQLSWAGHAHLALHILDVLGVPQTQRHRSGAARSAGSLAAERASRLLAGVTRPPHRATAVPAEPETLSARWPVPGEVPSRGGLSQLVRRGGEASAAALRPAPRRARRHLVG